MPVPLPAPAATKLTPPDAAEARVIAGGVAAAVAPSSGLTGLQQMLIEAITDAMTGFVVPGRAPPLLAQHDWMHVLGNYGSTVEAELEVFAFISRANNDPRAFSLLAGVISLFETGYMATGMGLFAYDRGHLSHKGMAVRLADALRRGALIGAHADGPDLLRIDWFERAHLPIDDVRAEFGVVPKSEAALETGSVGPWESGGISPYQYDAGQKKAAADGRDYESFGATPV
jgi:hypothetical protein